MKITCEREPLLAAFLTAASVVPSRSPKPILQNVKLTSTADTTTLMATDTEVGIRIEVSGVTVTSPGAMILPSRFGMLLRESTDETLTLASDGNSIHVQGQRSEFDLSAENPDEFPEVMRFEEAKYHELPARLMKELVKRTLFATESESSRYALGGVLLVLEDTKITAVGTDGRRLAKMEGPARSVGGQIASDQMTIVPWRAMHLIERALSDADAEIKLAARSNDILLRTERTTIYARLVEGRYPRWQDVIAERTDSVKIDITVGPFYSALRQAAIVASDESRGIDFIFGGGTLVVKASTAEVGQSRIEIPVAYDGEDIAITLDHRFVSDFLKVLPSEMTVTMSVKNNEQPADFRTSDGYHYVVMPLALKKK